MKKLILVLAAVAAGAFFYNQQAERPANVVPQEVASDTADAGREVEAAASGADAAYHDKRSNVQVQGSGVVSRVLPDDNEGSRHQRFILKLDSGLTLLVAHNVDLAPRIESLQAGDAVSYNGEYEWSEKGGVLHWTHHDPQGTHAGGWLKHKGRTYQ